MIDLESGEVMAWDDVLGLHTDVGTSLTQNGRGTLYSFPVFSRDGRSVAFLTRTLEGDIRLAFWDESGVVETAITFEEGERPAYSPSLTGLRIDWDSDDTMLVVTHLGVSVLTLMH